MQHDSVDNSTINNLTVIIGESEDLLINFLIDELTEVIYNKHELAVCATSSPDKIFQRAFDCNVDLFILTLNNLIFTDINKSSTKKIERMLQFVSDVKSTFQKPIITLVGWPDDLGFTSKVILAGADRCYKLPLRPKELKDAIRECLTRVTNIQ